MYGTQFAQTIPPRALDSDQSHFLHHLAGSNLSTNRNLTWVTGNVDRQVTLQGNPTLADWFDQGVKFTSSPTFTGLALLGFSGVVKSSLGVLSGFGGFSDLAFASADVNMGPYKFSAYRLESSIPSGTPPLVIASTDMVSNLNADLLDGQHASAFLVDISGQSLGDLSDVDTTGASAGDFLQKSAGDWVDFDLFAAANTWTNDNQFDGNIYLTNTSTGFVESSGEIQYNVASGNYHDFRVAAVTEMKIAANTLTFQQGINAVGLDWTTATQLDFQISAATEMFLTANRLSFSQAAGDASLNWGANNELGIRLNSFDRVKFTTTTIEPYTAGAVDLGTSSREFGEGHFQDDVLCAQLLVDTDSGGTANTTTYVHGSTPAPGIGVLPSWGNKPVGTSFGTWLHVYIGTTLHYIPTQA